MRTIKFRAWDKWNGKMFLPQLNGWKVAALEIGGVENSNGGFNEYPIMQFTGLFDKNGKEIYEGDIVKVPDDYNLYGKNAGEIFEIYFAVC